jgi:hypothetical protein
LAERLLLGSFRLLEDEAVPAIIVALEVRGGGFAAQVAIDALIIDVEFSCDVVAVFVRCVCHKSFCESDSENQRPPFGLQLFFAPE